MVARIIYSSEAAQQFTATELEQLLVELREKNRRQDVTGVLIFTDGVFMQVLEGPRDTLDTLMLKIRDDARHRNVTVFYDNAIDDRAFQKWRMAYVSSHADELRTWAGLEGTGAIDDLLTHLRDNQDAVPGFLVTIVSVLASR